jgi:hypothetical protein
MPYDFKVEIAVLNIDNTWHTVWYDVSIPEDASDIAELKALGACMDNLELNKIVVAHVVPVCVLRKEE